MTRQEIVQALRCCAKGLGHDDACENCKVGEIQDRREYIEFAAANVIERLTAENAALEPEAVETVKLALCAKHMVDLETLNNTPISRLVELAEADKDGRCVVLPCKVGDTVYFALLGIIVEKQVFSIVSFLNSTRIYCGGTSEYFRPEDIGKTFFLTREEAERALQEMEGKS